MIECKNTTTAWCKTCECYTLHTPVDGVDTCTKHKRKPTKENPMKKSKKSTTKKSTERKSQLSRAQKLDIADEAITRLEQQHPELTRKTLRQVALTMYVALGKKSS